jgi:hypothetical protein
MTDETKTEAPAVVYRYVGNGDHFAGIPARDLTKDDLSGLSDEDKKNVTKSGVYEKVGK